MKLPAQTADCFLLFQKEISNLKKKTPTAYLLIFCVLLCTLSVFWRGTEIGQIKSVTQAGRIG